MVGLSSGFVFHGQYWLVNHPVLSTGFVCQGNNGLYISRFCLLLTIWLVFNTVLSVVDKLVGISTGFVCHGQYWFLYLPVVFVMNYNGWYMTQLCLSWTILVGISHSIVSHRQY